MMLTRPALLLLVVFLALGAACGASARHKALKTSFVAATSLQAGFEAWDKEHQLDLADKATSYEDGVARLEAYWKKRTDVQNAFEALYRMIAAALLADEDENAFVAATRAYEQLAKALKILTGGKLP